MKSISSARQPSRQSPKKEGFQTANQVMAELKRHADSSRVAVLSSFFKTGKGQYGEGDIFIGLTVPQTRAVVAKSLALPLEEVKKLLEHKIHEFRLCALHILVKKVDMLYGKKADDKKIKSAKSAHKDILDFYMSHAAYINNWDLVDCSAHYVVGRYAFLHMSYAAAQKYLIAMTKSHDLWIKRIGMVSTFYYIQQGQPSMAFEIAPYLLKDTHDLIHKAVGWMLREAGKRDRRALDAFLHAHAGHMPRTALRYAIEKHSQDERTHFMAMKAALRG